MYPITILLVNPDHEAINHLSSLIEEMKGFQIIGHCGDGEQLVEKAAARLPDLIITAVKMPKKNGMEAIKEVRVQNPAVKVIYITNYEEFAVEAFEVAAVDYIVKPIDQIRLFKALEKARKMIIFDRNNLERSSLNLKFLPLKNRNSTILIPLNDICFIEKSGKKCLVYTTENIFETTEPISRIALYLDDSFFYGHRSYIVNLTKVSQITPHKESYIVRFQDCDHLAKISKLNINELKTRVSL